MKEIQPEDVWGDDSSTYCDKEEISWEEDVFSPQVAEAAKVLKYLRRLAAKQRLLEPSPSCCLVRQTSLEDP